MRRLSPPSKCHRTFAFTLIELLVVISIIAVLATLLVPVMGHVRAQADATKCAANLRTIGTGIASYTAEHDGRLPGPLQPLVYSVVKKGEGTSKGSLLGYIAQYVGISERNDNERAPETVGRCPAFERQMREKAKDGASFLLNYADKLEDLSNQAPWGDVNDGTEPVTVATLTTWRDNSKDQREASATGLMNLSRVWAIKDLDKEGFRDQPSIGGANIPQKPVHGEYRNALFYDWHVGRLNLEDKPQ